MADDDIMDGMQGVQGYESVGRPRARAACMQARADGRHAARLFFFL